MVRQKTKDHELSFEWCNFLFSRYRLQSVYCFMRLSLRFGTKLRGRGHFVPSKPCLACYSSVLFGGDDRNTQWNQGMKGLEFLVLSLCLNLRIV